MVVEAPRPAEFKLDTEEKAKPGRKPAASTKIQAEDIGQLIAACFYMYGQTRPEHVRGAWEYAPSDCRAVAEPAARILNRLPTKAFALVSNALDPIALVIASYALIEVSQRKEKEINARLAQFLAAQKQANSPSEFGYDGGTFAAQTEVNGLNHTGSPGPPSSPDNGANVFAFDTGESFGSVGSKI